VDLAEALGAASAYTPRASDRLRGDRLLKTTSPMAAYRSEAVVEAERPNFRCWPIPLKNSV